MKVRKDAENRLKAEFLQAFGLLELPSIQLSVDEPVAVVLAYNEILRFPYFLKHHRDIGIKDFIVIDNNSDDGSAEYLDRQPDVTRIFTANPYKENKSKWRQFLCDLFLAGRWVFFPDVDELFVYPGWPQLSVNGLVSYLNKQGYSGFFTSMVDMYPGGGLKELRYRSGQSFIEACSYFDNTGYRFVPLKGANGRAFEAPTRHIFGGTRERLFHRHANRPKNFIDRTLLNSVFSIHSHAPKSKFGRYLDRKLFKLVKNSLPGVDPLMSKVPLVKWSSGISYSGGVHSISGDVELAPDWGALLHFKYLDDFSSRVTAAIGRKQHAVNSRFYKDYVPHLDEIEQNGAMSSVSEQFTGGGSLLRCGLMRHSAKYKRHLEYFRHRTP